MKERPIELHSLGEVFAGEVDVEPLGEGLFRIVLVTEYDGRWYELARVIMPESSLRRLRAALDRLLADAVDEEDPRPSPLLQ